MEAADPQFRATVMPHDSRGHVVPQATVLNMTSQPLKTMAAAASMYRGMPVHDVRLMSDAYALEWWENMTKTRLTTPMEFIDIHFLLEGVTRAFTHQMVRQRIGAVYIQESMRFAIKDSARNEVGEPPSIRELPDGEPMRALWLQAVRDSAEAYDALINSGMPAQDARGILPTNITTRIHYKTNLRALSYHLGNRLSAQAQAEWKLVIGAMIRAIKRWCVTHASADEVWQYETILGLFKPVCFTTGKCEFMTTDDRWCPIRDRVEAHHAAGEPPETWTDIQPDDWTKS